MDIKNSIEKVKDFTLKRLIEFIGISMLVSSILIFVALISYSPDDPNFIYPKNQEINNILDFKFIPDYTLISGEGEKIIKLYDSYDEKQQCLRVLKEVFIKFAISEDFS